MLSFPNSTNKQGAQGNIKQQAVQTLPPIVRKQEHPFVLPPARETSYVRSNLQFTLPKPFLIPTLDYLLQYDHLP